MGCISSHSYLKLQISYIKHLIKGQTLELIYEKAIFWQEKELLIVADLHLGKATHFRKAGIGIPIQVELENLERLSTLLLEWQPRKVILLGDLFHSHINEVWGKFEALTENFKNISFVLIKGNHDILNESYYENSPMEIIEEGLEVGPFYFTHEPMDSAKLYNIHGHIHPGIRLKGKGLQSLRLPCFSFGLNSAIVPAFGGFTGLYCVDPDNFEDLYTISDDSVIKIK